MKKQLSNEFISETKNWLGDNGIKHFTEIKDKHGEIAAVWNSNGISYIVHFHEGMRVRNFMRNSGFCVDWNDHDFDNNWVNLIEECIK